MEQIELKDFVKETISSIAHAISELNEEQAGIGLVVNPKGLFKGPDSTLIATNNRIVSEVEFNLSISASSSSNTGGGVRLKVLEAGISGKDTQSAASSIRFTIPVCFPACAIPMAGKSTGR